MKPYETISLGARTLTINGIDIPVTLRASLFYDEDFRLDADAGLTDRDILHIERRIKDGYMAPTGIVVSAYAPTLGLQGEDSCWGFCLDRDYTAETAINEHAMQAQAVADLESQIKDMASKLHVFLEASAGG